MRILAVALLVSLGIGANAQEDPAKAQRPYIRTSGDSTISAKPDRAEIDIGVITQAASAQTAGAENARQFDSVVAEVKRLLGPGAEIRTAGYSLTPNYRYPKDGGRPQIAGYTASNTVAVRTSDLASVGKLLDSVTQSGANNIQRLQFSLKDEGSVRAQALADAVSKARANAEALAAAMGVRLAGVWRIEQEGAERIRPMLMNRMGAAMMTEAAAPPTPVEPGTVDVHAAVTLLMEIAR
jgi:uncharacterized protein